MMMTTEQVQEAVEYLNQGVRVTDDHDQHDDARLDPAN
jgi:hypothetical protein